MRAPPVQDRRKQNLEVVIFDFEGTLVDSRPLILESHRVVFSEFGMTAPLPAHSLALVGKSLDVILAELVGPTAPIPEMVKASDLLLPRLRADPAFPERPFDGIDALLRELAQPIILHWQSRRGTGQTPLRQRRRRCDGLSSFKTFKHRIPPSKPHPAMLLQALAATGVDAKDAIFIGDTTFDMQMAEAARLRSIGVGWGHHDPERLLAAGARHVARDVDELRAAILAALGG
jgi:phosphoglycolate phosphatase